MARESLIRCRVAEETKSSLQALAVQKGLTESALVRQLIETPDGQRFFTISRTIERPIRPDLRDDALLAIGLGCDVKHAHRIAYADGLDLSNTPATPVGPACAICTGAFWIGGVAGGAAWMPDGGGGGPANAIGGAAGGGLLRATSVDVIPSRASTGRSGMP